jgi:tetratricopeptide (TPR) repeat protein
MTKKIRPIILAVLIIFVALQLYSTQAHAQSPQQTLNQYIADLQKNPNDYALREKIIKHVQTMRPAPAIPEEAKRYIARGKAAFKGAKEVKDFNEAAEEFKKALLAAPWLAEGYYNLGVVQDKAGQYAAAMDSLKLYIIAAPNATDVEKVKELIYEIEYRQEKAAKESRPETVAAKKQNEYDVWLKNLNGARFAADSRGGHSALRLMGPVRDIFDIQGDEAIARDMLIRFDDQETARLNPHVHPGKWREKGRAKILNGQFTFQEVEGRTWARLSCTINKDGSKVTCVVRDSYNQEFSLVYYRSMEP